MESIDKQVVALELFNEKAKKLLSLSFLKKMTDPKSGILITVGKADDPFGLTITRKGPSQESVDAFVLTFRFFIQDNEISSFKNIANIYDNLVKDQFSKNLFNTARNQLNQFLDSPNKLGIVYDNQGLTNRTIMETFIYGGLAHANKEKQKMFKELMAIPSTASLLDASFKLVLGKVLNIIHYVAIVNDGVIKELKNNSK